MCEKRNHGRDGAGKWVVVAWLGIQSIWGSVGVSTTCAQDVDENPIHYKVDKDNWLIEVTTEDGFVHGLHIMSPVMARLFNPKFPNQLDLVDSQREEVAAKAAAALDKSVRELDRYISRRRLGKKALKDADLAQLEEPLLSIAQELEKDIRRNVLLRHQLEILDRYPLYLMIQKNGVFRMLAYGSLGEAVNLRDEQRKELEARADKMRQKIIDTVVRLEEEVHREMTDVLDPEQRRLVDAMRTDFVRSISYDLNNVVQQLDRRTIGSLYWLRRVKGEASRA